MNTGMCPYGMVNFTVANDDFRASSIVPGSQVPNPIVFRGSGSWTVSLYSFRISIIFIKYYASAAGTISTKYCDQQYCK